MAGGVKSRPSAPRRPDSSSERGWWGAWYLAGNTGRAARRFVVRAPALQRWIRDDVEAWGRIGQSLAAMARWPRSAGNAAFQAVGAAASLRLRSAPAL